MNYLLFCFIQFLGISHNAPWLYDLETAQSQAGESHKFILLNFSGSDWCIPCIKMDNQIFENARFIEFAAQHLVLLKADFPRLKKNALASDQLKRNEKLAERYNPDGIFPFTVVLDTEGKTLLTMEGLPKGNVNDFILQITETINQ